ncbi:hypothetical protein M011DRAFT_277907 [Sporormia fimetaria CBS 119925]|uniref:Uncharacterized protein n=1 Tax=Sporormia fimetaria CBS 119925 TaxID=1340428 RepID=A0A6A6VJD1_9PLEO|nr:hypothetical protein M011DRAFT_277907 [Sporormia fimetaria CBS 119925]
MRTAPERTFGTGHDSLIEYLSNFAIPRNSFQIVLYHGCSWISGAKNSGYQYELGASSCHRKARTVHPRSWRISTPCCLPSASTVLPSDSADCRPTLISLRPLPKRKRSPAIAVDTVVMTSKKITAVWTCTPFIVLSLDNATYHIPLLFFSGRWVCYK